MARRRVPQGAFELAVQVRSYEVGREGRVRPANVLRYFEYLATEASTARGFDHIWYEQHGTAWVVRDMRLVVGALPGIGDNLRMATWVSSFGRVQALREYALWREEDQQLLARAQGRWAYVDRVAGQLRRLSEDLSVRIGALGGAMPAWTLPLRSTAGGLPLLTLSARAYEADSQQHINNTVYMDWLEEATNVALANAPDAADTQARLRRIHLEYLRPALPGDTIQVNVGMVRRSQHGVVADYEVMDERRQAAVVRAHALYLSRGRFVTGQTEAGRTFGG